MLTIRKDQMAAFSEAAIRSFVDRMIVHLHKFFPQQCEALGAIKTNEAIQYGIQRAATYSIITERDVCKYIDLMFTFDRDFDTAPHLPWAREILNDQSLEDPTTKINRLCDTAMQNEAQATGLKNDDET